MISDKDFKNKFKDFKINDGEQYTNINVLNTKEKYITDYFELKRLLDKYLELLEMRKNASKLEQISIKEKISDIESLLIYGLKIDDGILDNLRGLISDFSEEIGIDSNIFKDRFSEMELTISPVKVLSNGHLCNYGKYISVDISYGEFDDDGNFIRLKEEKKDFFKHTLVHELLHSISRQGYLYMDSFSEGMTEYFAHKISKATEVISSYYEYSEKVFYMFGLMMGDDLLFEDYVTNLDKMPNLTKFVGSLGVSKEEFLEFKKDMDKYLELKSNKNSDLEKISELENKNNEFLFSKIILPYCSYDDTKAQEFMNILLNGRGEIQEEMFEINLNGVGDTNKVK